MRKCLLFLLLLLVAFPVSAQIGNDDIDMVPFVSRALNIQGLRPDGWVEQENSAGVFVRGRDPLDATAVIMQAQETEKAAFLDSVRTSFDLTGSLDVLETIETDYLTWETYQFERIQAEQELIVDMAVAEDAEEGRVYYVLLQTNAVFYDSLHEEVFLPAVQWMSSIQTYQDADSSFSFPVPVQWSVRENENGYTQITNVDDSIGILVKAYESDDPIATAQEFLRLVNPEFDQTFDEDVHNLRVVDNPNLIGGLDSVHIIDWVDGSGEDGFVLQTVGRVYDDTIYMMLIVSNVEAILTQENDLTIIDSGFTISALTETSDTVAEDQGEGEMVVVQAATETTAEDTSSETENDSSTETDDETDSETASENDNEASDSETVSENDDETAETSDDETLTDSDDDTDENTGESIDAGDNDETSAETEGDAGGFNIGSIIAIVAGAVVAIGAGIFLVGNKSGNEAS